MNQIEQIWKEYHTKLHSFIQSRVGDRSNADDILQEVFIRIHSRIGTLRENSKIQSWIYQIARNAIIDHYRAKKKMTELPETLTTPELEPGDKARQEIAACLLPLIQSLPEHYRQTLMLSEIEGLTQKEVAVKQEVSLSGVKARIRRGRSMMKDMLLACCRFEFDHQGKMIDYEEQGPTCDKC
jgi:RNA polymerase sigma-70 factor (ECF subfamily)